MDVWYDGTHGISFYKYGTDENPLGELIGHTWKKWGLIPKTRPFVVPPEKKITTIDIPGADGVLDVSESLTKWPVYNNRTGSWSFYVTDYNNHEGIIQDNNDQNVLDNVYDPIRDTTIDNWAGMYTRFLNDLHGKTLAIVLDDDPDYYYKGRVTISQWDSPNDGTLSGVTISYDLYPYKLKREFEIFPISIPAPSAGNIATGTVSFSGGRRPVVLQLRTESNNPNTANSFYLSFQNGETGEFAYSVSFKFHCNVWTNLEHVRGYDGSNWGYHDFIVTNIFGNNKCQFGVSCNSLALSEVKKVEIRFRVGEL